MYQVRCHEDGHGQLSGLACVCWRKLGWKGGRGEERCIRKGKERKEYWGSQTTVWEVNNNHEEKEEEFENMEMKVTRRRGNRRKTKLLRRKIKGWGGLQKRSCMTTWRRFLRTKKKHSVSMIDTFFLRILTHCLKTRAFLIFWVTTLHNQ
jgi:hypothetical protein